MSEITRVQILVRGMVQGVGFRPFVFSLARRRALKGQVHNNAIGVLIEVEGEGGAIEGFIEEITVNPPTLSLIESVERSGNLDLANYPDFRIVESAAGGEKLVPVAADAATCADCLREMFDPLDRRYRYPFINCTNCGPRFTIIEGVPYDREQTTMRHFAMCAWCRAEYENPLDRRFHAEPTACARCGPRLYLTDSSGLEIAGDEIDGLTAGQAAINRARQWLLVDGKIVAIKGIGGFHLAVNALDHAPVARLRSRKHREDKPFALMARSVDVIRKFCFVSAAEEELLLSAPRPVVLLERRCQAAISPAVAPHRIGTLGFM
ncbi:MAG: Sua5/YciO/YrdC/YwlC family protein, partial [Acidobacteriota bacterium]|nr:Sua5/YciO/YrdC/YwlC family protein [Acidobacteriota bacterium]